MSRSVAEVTGKMPFAGKHVVKSTYEHGRESSRHGRIGGKIASSIGLVVFAGLHARQLDMGINELVHHSGDQNAAEVGIDAAYTMANAMATYTQAYLGLRVLGTRSEVVTAAPEGVMAVSGPPRKEIEPLKMPSATELAVTLGGQILFVATMK